MRKVWLLLGVVLLTSACRLETNVSIDVADDGSGTVTTELGLDEEMRGLLDSFGGEEVITSLDLGGASPTETRTDGDMTFYGATQPFADVSDLEALVRENDEQVIFDEFSLDVTDDGALLIARMAPLSEQRNLNAQSLPFDPASLTDDVFAASLFAKLPGTVVTHNADEVMADGRLRWDVSFTEAINIEAETSFGGNGIPWIPIGIVGAATVAGLAGMTAARRNRKNEAAALASTEAPPAPMDFSDLGAASTELPPELPPQDGT